MKIERGAAGDGDFYRFETAAIIALKPMIETTVAMIARIMLFGTVPRTRRRRGVDGCDISILLITFPLPTGDLSGRQENRAPTPRSLRPADLHQSLAALLGERPRLCASRRSVPQ